MSFKDEYAKFTKPSSEREQFVYRSIVQLPREQIVRSMKPITVTRPDGAKITYKVMPDYVTVDGVRVPMSGNTAQKVADHFGLSLPTAAMAKEIYQKADVRVSAKPLSGTGTNIGGHQYSGKDVVDVGVGHAPFALKYNENIDKQLSEKGVDVGSNNQVVSGFAKEIIAPPAPGKLGLFGMFDAKGNPIQGGSGETPHDTTIHSEYGSFLRMVSPEATITYPDGRVETKPTNSVYQSARYTPRTDKKELAVAPTPKYSPEKPKSGRLQLLQRIDNFLNRISS